MKKVFISYAHDNLNDQNELIKHLSVLKRNGLISDWSDNEIKAGENWDNMIKKKLDDVDIVLFLVSSEFLASEYINNVEIESSIKNYKENNVKVIPVILNNCMWQETILNNFQAVPSNKGRLKPISEWNDKNKAFYTVSIELMRSLKNSISNDIQITKIYDYKKEVSKWTSKSEKKNSYLSLDYLFKLLLMTFLVLAVIGFFYTLVFIPEGINDKIGSLVISFSFIMVSMTAFFGWRLMEFKYLNKELNNSN